jgi:hypothetical protein
LRFGSIKLQNLHIRATKNSHMGATSITAKACACVAPLERKEASMLRKIIISAAVAAGLMATPAFAQSFSHDFGSGNVSAKAPTMTAGGAYAYAGHHWQHR